MEIVLVILAVAHAVACALAGDQRTIGPIGGFFLGLIPVAGAVLILAWPSRLEAAEYYRRKKEELAK